MPNVRNISVNTATALVPTAYSLQAVTITNHAGRSSDIKQLVTDFSITESIYRPSLMLSLNIRDPINLLEEFKFTGQETINVVIARRPIGSQDVVKVNLKFYVTEYPLLGKPDSRLQVYTMRGISQHAFVSSLKKISRAWSGNIIAFVQSVLTQDLGVPASMINASKSSSVNASFIVPNMTPLDAISWALRRAFDSYNSPFYCFQTLDGVINIQSLADMASQSSYQEYLDSKFFKHSQDGLTEAAASYQERATRILSIDSDLRMSKYLSAPSGAFASTSKYLDISTKSLVQQDYDYAAQFSGMKTIDKYSVLSPSFQPETNDALSDYPNSRVNYLPMNSLALDTGQNYNSSTHAAVLNEAQSYIENLDTLVHDLVLAGDFQLNPGKIISLKLPPPIDPTLRTKNSDASGTPQKDGFFSGNYLVVSTVHHIDDEYTMDIKVKKDSFPFSLS